MNWPGRPDAYTSRVDVEDVRYTTPVAVCRAFDRSRSTSVAAWTVANACLDDDDLFRFCLNLGCAACQVPSSAQLVHRDCRFG